MDSITAPVSLVEPVNEPRLIKKRVQSIFDDNQSYCSVNSKEATNDKAMKFYSVTQIVHMEKSVYDHLGHSINVYI
jgi:hypothetical protein